MYQTLPHKEDTDNGVTIIHISHEKDGIFQPNEFSFITMYSSKKNTFKETF